MAVIKSVKTVQILLTEKSKEELIEEILRLRKENELLREALETKAKAEAQKKLLKMLRASQRAIHPKAPGRKVGHEGITRIKPRQIDRAVEQTLKRCPDCHYALSKSQEVTEHIQEDIIPAHPEVTLFKKHRYWCRHCEKLVTAPYASEEIPRGNLGSNVLIQTVILKYHHGLPFNKIRELFRSLAHFEVSEGALAQSLQRMAEWLQVEEAEILKAVRASPHLHMDETGWKVSGENHWLWAAVNERLAYYRIRRSRGRKVAREIVTKDYPGILVTDFYAAYNGLGRSHQKCLVHLKREMHACYQTDQTPEFLKYHKRLKRILGDALKLKALRDALEPSVYERRVKLLERRLFLWSCRDHENKNLRRLAKRFLKYWLDLLTFLKRPEIPFHNNLAERMIRPHVILRNRSFQNRSEKGAKAHETLMSLLHTLKLQDKDPLRFLKRAYLKHRQGSLRPILSF